MKKYSEYSKKLKEDKISDQEIKKLKIYNFIKEKFPNSNIYISYFSSLCNKKVPDKIRLRNDSFLKDAVENKISFLLSGIKIKDYFIVICFCTTSFFGYKFKTDSSNSFIVQNYLDLYKLNYNNQDSINYWTYGKNKKYMFYSSYCNDFNDIIFINEFINRLNFSTDNQYKPVVSTSTNIYVPEIPNYIRANVRNIYNDMCALSIGKTLVCPCGNNINRNFLKKNNLTYTHLHHFIPKSFFISKYNSGDIDKLDWNIIHSPHNLVPLCLACHESIHKGKANIKLVKNTFKCIIDSYRYTNRYEHFINFIKNETFLINENEILEFYLK